jgi:hypothetical protein
MKHVDAVEFAEAVVAHELGHVVEPLHRAVLRAVLGDAVVFARGCRPPRGPPRS